MPKNVNNKRAPIQREKEDKPHEELSGNILYMSFFTLNEMIYLFRNFYLQSQLNKISTGVIKT